MEIKKQKGRPKSDDPKIKFDNIRLKTSTLIDIDVIAEQLSISKSYLVRTILENEIEKYKNLLQKS